MADIITFPARGGTESMAALVWATSRSLLEAARLGRRDAAMRLGIWLTNTARHKDCTEPLARVIDGTLKAARDILGGTAPAFEPIQPDDGEVA